MANQTFDFCMRMLNPFIQDLINFKNHLTRDRLTRTDMVKQKLLRKFIESYERLSRNPDLTIHDIMNMDMDTDMGMGMGMGMNMMRNSQMDDDMNMRLNRFQQNFRQQDNNNDEEYKLILEIFKGKPANNSKVENKVEQKVDQKALTPEELEGKKNKELVDKTLNSSFVDNVKLQKKKYVAVDSIQRPDNETGEDTDDDDNDDDDDDDDNNNDNNTDDKKHETNVPNRVQMPLPMTGTQTTPLNINTNNINTTQNTAQIQSQSQSKIEIVQISEPVQKSNNVNSEHNNAHNVNVDVDMLTDYSSA